MLFMLKSRQETGGFFYFKLSDCQSFKPQRSGLHGISGEVSSQTSNLHNLIFLLLDAFYFYYWI